MSDQLPNQIIINPDRIPSFFKSPIFFVSLILLVILISALIIFRKSISLPLIKQLNSLFTSCQPDIERTPNRKTGVVAIENRDGTFTDVTLYQSGEKNIISNYILEKSSNAVKLNNLYLRGGKVISVDKKNNVLLIDVGDGSQMIIQITKDQLIRVKKAKVYFGYPTSESFIKDAKLCHIQQGDTVGLLIHQSDVKLYDKAFVVPAIEIVQ